MAKAQPVIGDLGSAEFDELRRAFNSLLKVLENVALAVDAGDITADEAFTVLYTSISGGVDVSQENVDSGSNDYTGTDEPVAGVKPMPDRPRSPRVTSLVDL